jgi:uncharacterized protein (TIGR02597 family)
MKPKRTRGICAGIIGLVALGAVDTAPLLAEVASDPAGFCKLTFLGNSDTIVSLPFARPAACSGSVLATSGNVIQALGAPNWLPNQFVYAAGVQSNTYYLRFDSGASEGRYYPITANDTNTLTLNLGSDTLAGIAVNDLFSVVPYWTLGSVFPGGKGVFASTSTIIRKTEVLIPNYSGSGINLSASATYYFFTNVTTGAAAWRLVGSSSLNRNDDVLQPNVYLIVRHKVATNTSYTSLGSAILTKIGIPLRVNSTTKQDNTLALARPVLVSLDNSGLISTGAFTPSTSTISRKDELLAFDNTTTNFNKSAAATYYYFNSAWRKVGVSATINVGSSNVFVPGMGFIIRKSTGTTAPLWSNNPTY